MRSLRSSICTASACAVWDGPPLHGAIFASFFSKFFTAWGSLRMVWWTVEVCLLQILLLSYYLRSCSACENATRSMALVLYSPPMSTATVWGVARTTRYKPAFLARNFTDKSSTVDVKPWHCFDAGGLLTYTVSFEVNWWVSLMLGSILGLYWRQFCLTFFQLFETGCVGGQVFSFWQVEGVNCWLLHRLVLFTIMWKFLVVRD